MTYTINYHHLLTREIFINSFKRLNGKTWRNLRQMKKRIEEPILMKVKTVFLFLICKCESI